MPEGIFGRNGLPGVLHDVQLDYYAKRAAAASSHVLGWTIHMPWHTGCWLCIIRVSLISSAMWICLENVTVDWCLFEESWVLILEIWMNWDEEKNLGQRIDGFVGSQVMGPSESGMWPMDGSNRLDTSRGTRVLCGRSLVLCSLWSGKFQRLPNTSNWEHV